MAIICVSLQYNKNKNNINNIKQLQIMETKKIKQSEIFELACKVILHKVNDIDLPNADLETCRNALYDIHNVIFNAERTFDFMTEFIKYNSQYEND